MQRGGRDGTLGRKLDGHLYLCLGYLGRASASPAPAPRCSLLGQRSLRKNPNVTVDFGELRYTREAVDFKEQRDGQCSKWTGPRWLWLMPSTPQESHNQGTGMRAIFLCINQPIDRLTTGRSMNILAHGKRFWHTLPDLTHTHPFHSPRHPTHPLGIWDPPPAQDHHESHHNISSQGGDVTAGTDVRQ